MPSTGKDRNSFAIHSARSLHWSIFVSQRDSSCCRRFGFRRDLVHNRSVIPLGGIPQTVTNGPSRSHIGNCSAGAPTGTQSHHPKVLEE
jgi:hypothetical protein